MKEIPLYFFLFITLLNSNCGNSGEPEKSSIVTGQVKDAKTNVGLDSVKITYTTTLDDGINNHSPSYHSVITNGDGLFTFDIPTQDILMGPVYFEKSQYNKLIIYIDGLDNKISLWRNDSWLRLVMKNDLGQHDALFVSLSNKDLYPGFIGAPGPTSPVILNMNETQTDYFTSSSYTYTVIKWGFSFGQYPNVDSVLMPPNDTAEFILSY